MIAFKGGNASSAGDPAIERPEEMFVRKTEALRRQGGGGGASQLWDAYQKHARMFGSDTPFGNQMRGQMAYDNYTSQPGFAANPDYSMADRIRSLWTGQA